CRVQRQEFSDRGTGVMTDPARPARRRSWKLNPTQLARRRERRAFAMEANPAKETFIYIIRAGEFAKIGKSDAWRDRVDTMQTGSPYTIVPLLVLRAPPVLERQLHRLFAEDHFRGEWFYLSEDIRAFVRKNRTKCVAKIETQGRRPPRPKPENVADDL
ncbi:MAG TPA: GIY-YIG nuclease family protein, partial [Bradyrhizobium sp.]|nr:GIY-YIG nuclease family protein [Bradyrhizobium sp.]